MGRYVHIKFRDAGWMGRYMGVAEMEDRWMNAIWM